MPAQSGCKVRKIEAGTGSVQHLTHSVQATNTVCNNHEAFLNTSGGFFFPSFSLSLFQMSRRGNTKKRERGVASPDSELNAETAGLAPAQRKRRLPSRQGV